LKIKNILIILIFTTTLSIAGESQFGLVNQSLGNLKLPYSASGIARSYEMAYSDSVQLNFRNYSTWTNITQTTFSLSMAYNAYWGENRVENSFVDNANFDGVFLAIPLKQRKLVFGAGVIPFTSLEQRLVTESIVDGENVSTSNYINGGASKATFNLLYKVVDEFSIGLGYEYTFGKITDDIRMSIDDDLSSTIDFSSERQVSGNGLVLSMFGTPFKDLNAGLVIRPSVIGELTKSAESPSDKLDEEEILDLTLPAEYNFGLEYSISPSYSVGMDLTWQDWKSGYKIDDVKVDDHETYYHIGIGIERKGSRRKFVKYGEQIDLRIGGFYNQLSTINDLKKEKVSEIGFSAGLSLPIQRFKSKIDLAAFISRRGNLSKNLLEETIVGFSFSVSATELWFVNLED